MPRENLSKKVDRIEQRLDEIERAVHGRESASISARRLLTTEEAAAFLGMTIDGLRGLTYKKLIPYYKPNGKNMYFDVDELVAWQKKNHFEPLAGRLEGEGTES